MRFDEPEDSTPLEPEEVEELIPSHLVNRSQLNALEQHNILKAELWLTTARFKKINDEKSLKTLHFKMFEEVWRWAGSFRKTEKNIGVAPYRIAIELRNLCNDVDAWIAFESYSKKEIAVRFHHRLVSIHPFPNGNGRHARLATDVLLLKQLSLPRFSWGNRSLDNIGNVRKRYIESLQAADNGDYEFLMAFVE